MGLEELCFWLSVRASVPECRHSLTGLSSTSRFTACRTICLAETRYTCTRLTALCPGLPRWASTRKVKPIRILLKQETVSGSGISWAVCKCAPRSRQITMPAPHHSGFYGPDALPDAQPTVSKHWRQRLELNSVLHFIVCYNVVTVDW